MLEDEEIQESEEAEEEDVDLEEKDPKIVEK
jgi:hypothetical protein